MSKGKLFVISGASGVGKSTVLAKVMAQREDVRFSVSATTRPPRLGETDGVNYYFVSRERFENMIAEDAFLEYDSHMANYYGTPTAQMEEKLLGSGNAQALVERIYTRDTVYNNILENQMERAEARDRTVKAIMQLLRKKRIVLL